MGDPHPADLEKKIAKLMSDEDVTKKSGIYPYVLTGDERTLSHRAFTDNQKREAYERQKGICVKCKKRFELDEMEGDHDKPWHEGGKTNALNPSPSPPGPANRSMTGIRPASVKGRHGMGADLLAFVKSLGLHRLVNPVALRPILFACG